MPYIVNNDCSVNDLVGFNFPKEVSDFCSVVETQGLVLGLSKEIIQ